MVERTQFTVKKKNNSRGICALNDIREKANKNVNFRRHFFFNLAGKVTGGGHREYQDLTVRH